MKLYLLKYPVGTYNEILEIVVRAPNEARARSMACEEGKTHSRQWVGPSREPSDHWLDPSLTTCEEVPQDGPEAVICVDFYES